MLSLFLFILLVAAVVPGCSLETETATIQDYISRQNFTEDRPAVVDMFVYNGEPMGLYRLYYLRDVVDFFVITEASETFSGLAKPQLYLDEDMQILHELRKEGRLIEIKLKALPLPLTFDPVSRKGRNATYEAAWARERLQRNTGMELLFETMGGRPFVLLVLDSDELPRKEYVAQLGSKYRAIGRGARLLMINMIYNFKWKLFMSHGNKWPFPFVTTDYGIRACQKDPKVSDPSEVLHLMRAEGYFMKSMNEIQDAGWHCSYCMENSDIARKLGSFSHLFLNKAKFKSDEWINKCKAEGLYIFQKNKDHAKERLE
jgi:hypothetical protein